MPSRFVIKDYASNSYYHVFNRGVAKSKIYLDDQDYSYFLYLLKRHLDKEEYLDTSKRPCDKYYDEIDLVAYCLMPNHFHLLLYQKDSIKALTKLLASVTTAYAMYFNRKYKRVGHLFQGRYKASRISSDSYLQHITRYIHLNPSDYRTYPWSSYRYYIDKTNLEWLHPENILAIFNGETYAEFVNDYISQKAILEEIKHELANY